MQIALTFPACHRKGGVERILVECANFLAPRHEVHVLAANFDNDCLAPNIHRHQIPADYRNTLLHLEVYRRRATATLESLRKANSAPAHAAFGVTSPPGGILWVQSVHAEWLKIAQANRPLSGRIRQRLNPFHPYILRLEKRYYRQKLYRHLIALTPRVKQELIEHYDVPDKDISILPNGFNPTEFNPTRRITERETLRKTLGYTPDDRVLVFVANELERKGFFPLIEALAAMRDPELKLLVVGRVDLAPHMEKLRSLNIANQVRATGPSADVAAFYAAADIFVLPTYYEAWGLVIVEALAAGIPVLTSRLAGAAPVIQEGATGLLLDNPRDPAEIQKKLTQLLTLKTPSPEAISKSVQNFNWPTILQKYESILQNHAPSTVTQPPFAETRS